ncbi:MAG: DUF4398 domain-containing protein [Mariprofundaceae bacterium]
MRGTLAAVFVALMVLSACATKPPVQEMAEARAAISAARSVETASGEEPESLISAERALQKASKAIEKKQFERARQLAREAKRKAQQAASIKQRDMHE